MFDNLFNNNQDDKTTKIQESLINSIQKLHLIEDRKRLPYLPLTETNISALVNFTITQIKKYSQYKRQENQTSSFKKEQDYIKLHFDKLNDLLFAGLTLKQENGTCNYALPLLYQNINHTNCLINSLLLKIKEIAEEQVNIVKENARTIQNQHQTISKYENDVILKVKKDLLMQFIDIADQIRYTLADQIKQPDYDALLESVKMFSEWIDGILKDNSVRKFETKESTQFDPKLQEIEKTEYTKDVTKNGIFKSVSPGYFWTMPIVGSPNVLAAANVPQKFTFVLRHETVVKLEYRPTNDSSNAINATFNSSVDTNKNTEEKYVSKDNCNLVSTEDNKKIDKVQLENSDSNILSGTNHKSVSVQNSLTESNPPSTIVFRGDEYSAELPSFSSNSSSENMLADCNVELAVDKGCKKVIDQDSNITNSCKKRML